MDYKKIKDLLNGIEATGQVTDEQNQAIADALTQQTGIQHSFTDCKPCLVSRIETLRDLIKDKPVETITLWQAFDPNPDLSKYIPDSE